MQIPSICLLNRGAYMFESGRRAVEKIARKPQFCRAYFIRSFMILLFSIAAASNLLSQANQYKRDRPVTPDDLFRMETIGETVLSPDGQWLAYVRRRPLSTEPFRGYAELLKNDHADVWVARVSGDTPKNITNGAIDSSGFWLPRWSPDGQRLAMLSTRGGNIRLWMWTKSTGHLEMLCDRGVEPLSLEGFWDTHKWISDKQIVVAVLPPGLRPIAMYDTVVSEKITKEWAKAQAGREPTASALESGIAQTLDDRPQSDAMVIDVVTKSQKNLTKGLTFGDYVLSPNKRYLAILKQIDVWRPDPNKMVTTLVPVIYQLLIADIQADFQIRTVSAIKAPLQGSLLWSPDSSELALVAYTREAATGHSVFRYRMSDGQLRTVTNDMSDLDPFTQNRFIKPPMMWQKNGNMLMFSTLNPASIKGNEANTARWWSIDERGVRVDLFKGSSSIPSQIIRDDTLGTLVGLVNGSLRRITDDGQILEPVAAQFNQKISTILFTDNNPGATNLRSRLYLMSDSAKKQLIVRTDPLAADNLFMVDLPTGQVRPVAKPYKDATLVSWNAAAATTAFLTANDTGTYLSSMPGPGKSFVKLLETNTFVRELWLPDFKKISYRSSDGKDLTGWIMLPFGYQEGKKYPTVLDVYPTRVYGDRPPALWRWVDIPTPYNLQFLAGRGYAVLFPSMPLPGGHGERRDPYMELTKGVLPAIDEAVRIGITDPERIGIFGASFGGYATYGLVTQTNRFRAAVSMCGPADLISLWGTFATFDNRSRYDDFAHEDLFRMHNVEVSMGPSNPPWKDLAAYLRNSPMTYVERIQTPIMIMQGDQDTIGIEQGEEMFTALYRQGKRARFVRYWGEDHTIMSPANVRDMWQQIFRWFDEFLMESEKKKATATR